MPNNLWTEAVFLCVTQSVSYVNRKAKRFAHFKLLAKSQVIQPETQRDKPCTQKNVQKHILDWKNNCFEKF